ncbi:golgin subfamily A member 6-like protein 2 isoform X3 [Eurytemora carolleeae]|uniref:golgin subfamily A member 6-like protein 2 isoform X3 n=1 Tax=Eurytemora carolleeae TaxID=1294199 RepID=UPI000C78C881|nr:golgin subfamily A member 6-like protein 2 isoform X3 [Eurytemora carolleeae]|eukprot:XP_023335970.1 golgin subfamily A member 6-like protein 2 isoform X3 [Eurytemora affinis]
MEEQLWAVFQACNPDTEGFISIQELANISRSHVDSEDVEKILSIFTASNQDRLDFPEFQHQVINSLNQDLMTAHNNELGARLQSPRKKMKRRPVRLVSQSKLTGAIPLVNTSSEDDNDLEDSFDRRIAAELEFAGKTLERTKPKYLVRGSQMRSTVRSKSNTQLPFLSSHPTLEISPIRSDDGSASGQNIYESTPCKTGSELREQVLDQLRNPEQLNLEEESRIRRSSSENSVFQQVSLDAHGMDSRSIESDKRWREVQVPGLNYRPRSPRWNEGEEKEEKETQEMDQEEKMEAKKKEKEEKMKVNGAKNIFFRLAEEDEFNQTKRSVLDGLEKQVSMIQHQYEEFGLTPTKAIDFKTELETELEKVRIEAREKLEEERERWEEEKAKWEEEREKWEEERERWEEEFQGLEREREMDKLNYELRLDQVRGEVDRLRREKSELVEKVRLLYEEKELIEDTNKHGNNTNFFSMEDSQEEMSKMSLDSDKTDRTENSRTEIYGRGYMNKIHQLVNIMYRIADRVAIAPKNFIRERINNRRFWR